MRFIRKNGRIIPIKAGKVAKVAAGAVAGSKIVRGAGAVAGGAIALKSASPHHKSKIKVNNVLDLAGLGLSVASGVVGAFTFSGGVKSFIGGAVATHAIDAVGISANAASVAGHKHGKDRAKQFIKQEARNLAVGNAVYLGGIVGLKRNRQALNSGIKSVAKNADKILSVARKVLRVG